MRDIFPGHYRSDDSKTESIWKNAIFIFDTNTLLNLYRYTPEASDDFLFILQSIKDRIRIPHQVALEYQSNRTTVIAEQINKFGEVRKTVNDAINTIVNTFNRFQLKERHSTINPDEFLGRLQKNTDEFITQLNDLESQQRDVHHDDLVRDRLDEIFENHVSSSPSSQEELDKIYKEGQKRYEKKIPPGYKDSDKSDTDKDDHIHNNMVFLRKYGDLIIWKQIINIALAEKRDIIFIIDDRKEDWWWNIQSRGKKTLGPRPELIEEIKKSAGIDNFLMYNSKRFVLFSEEYLGLSIRRNSIQQISDIADQGNSHIFDSNFMLNIEAINAIIDGESVDSVADTAIIRFQEFTNIVEEITLFTNKISSQLNDSSGKLDSLDESKLHLDSAEVQEILLESSNYMNEYAKEIERLTPIYAMRARNSIESSIKAFRGFYEQDKEKPQKMVDSLDGTLNALIQSESNSDSFREAVYNLRALTKDMGDAKNRTVSALDNLIAEQRNFKKMVEQAIDYFNSVE